MEHIVGDIYKNKRDERQKMMEMGGAQRGKKTKGGFFYWDRELLTMHMKGHHPRLVPMSRRE